MKTLELAGLALLAFLVAGCPKKPEPGAEKKPAAQKAGPTAVPGALPVDSDYASGKVEAVVLEMQTRLDVAMAPEEKVDEEVKKARQAAVTTQRLTVSDSRGKLVFTTEDFYVPQGTELRYNPAQKKYALAAPEKKRYWAMTGAEIGNLLEGGPVMTRSNYQIQIVDTDQKETVAGYQTVKSEATISFDWQVKTRSGGDKKGKVKAKLAIWHAGDEKLKPAWGDLIVDFLTVPFQDEGGRKVVETLKERVKFPLKWAMEVAREGQAAEKGDLPPKLVTVAQKVELKEVAKAELASPPPGFQPASAPYEFGPGGQTAKEELLSKLPVRKGTPPE